MGSFDVSCSLSDMPIGCGTECYIFLIQTCGHDAWRGFNWVPRSGPVLGTYDDYGRFEFKPAELERIRFWQQQLDKDLIPLLPGDNQYHDCETRRGMPIDDLLSQLSHYQGKVMVAKDHQDYWQNIDKIQQELLGQIQTCLNSVEPNWRTFLEGNHLYAETINYHESEKFDELIAALAKINLTGVKTKDPKSSGWRHNLLILLHPENTITPSEPPLLPAPVTASTFSVAAMNAQLELTRKEEVRLAWIRKDVWDAAQELWPPTTYDQVDGKYKDQPLTVERLRKLLDQIDTDRKSDDPFKRFSFLAKEELTHMLWFTSYTPIYDHILADDRKQETLKRYLELRVINDARRHTGHILIPGTNRGSQFAGDDYPDHEKWHRALTKIAKQAKRQDRE